MSRSLLTCAMAALSFVSVIAVSSEANAQNAKVLQDTPRWGVARQASLLNAQVFGAVRAFDRLVGNKPPATLTFGFETNWLWAATETPGYDTASKRWVLQDIDLYANNAAIQLCTSSFVRACAFYSSSLTVTFAPDNVGSRMMGSLVSFTGPLIYGHVLAPLALAGVAEGKNGINAIQSSVMGGASVMAGDYFTARAGFIGSVDQRGLYANASSPRLKAFVTTAITDQFHELSTLMGGFENLDIKNIATDAASSTSSTAPLITAYARQLKLKAPQVNPDAELAGKQILGKFDMQSFHGGLDNLAGRFDVHVAYATQPKPVLHEARVGANLFPKPAILRIAGGVTQLPSLPFYGVSGGLRPYFAAEIGGGREDVAVLKYSIRFNDAETLTYFPFAQNSVNMFFMFAAPLDGNLRGKLFGNLPTMKLAWATDIHLNFLEQTAIEAFCASVVASGADGLLITGDISEARDLAHHLAQIDALVQRPVYFVLGNHDAYRGSVEGSRACANTVASASRWLRYLPSAGVITLDDGVSIVGVDGWADARLGDWSGSDVVLNDYILIAELKKLSKDVRAGVLQRIADADATLARELLTKAFSVSRRVIFLTHVPPFRGATWHEGQVSDDNWMPHFSCKAVGDVLVDELEGRTDRELLVLCGHTHGAGVYWPLPNLEVRTGGAAYGAPALQMPLITSSSGPSPAAPTR